MLGEEKNPAEREERSVAQKIGVVLAMVAILASMAILFAIRREHKPTGPQQVRELDAYASKLVIGDLTMSEAEAVRISAKSLYVDGRIQNNGDKTLAGLSVQAVFHGADGAVVYAETTPLRLVRTREPYVDMQEIAATPIAPGQMRDFRVIFEGLPETWDGQTPEIRAVKTTLK